MILGSLLIIAYVLVYIQYVYPKSEHVHSVTAKMVSMSLGMINGLMIGLLLGLLFQGNLAFSTIVAILMGFGIAYAIGKPFGVHGLAEAISSSLMGSMMGAMLGEMLTVPMQAAWMMMFMESLYIIAMSAVILLANRMERKQEISTLVSKPTFSFVLAMIIPLLITGAINLYSINPASHPEMNSHGVHHHTP